MSGGWGVQGRRHLTVTLRRSHTAHGPARLDRQHAIRRYGFHGTSHKYLVGQAAGMLGKQPEQLNAITCHLGA